MTSLGSCCVLFLGPTYRRYYYLDLILHQLDDCRSESLSRNSGVRLLELCFI